MAALRGLLAPFPWKAELLRATMMFGIAVTCVFAAVDSPSAHLFLNSAEPQCNGSDPTVLLCDDFEDGTWYLTNCDTGESPGDTNGRANPVNQGWCGSIYHIDLDEHDYARCGSLGAVGTNCTSTSTFRATGGEAQGQGFHLLGPLTATGYTDVYHRYYVKFLTGYVFGHEKLVFYQADATDVASQFFVLQTPFGSPCFDVGPANVDIRIAQNQGAPLCYVPGHWHYMEVHIRLNDVGVQNGIIEVWADDCGTNGLGCTGPGTLRLRSTNVILRTSNILCCDIHQENWCPPPGGAGTCRGEVYNDQIVVATRRVGPMSSSGSGATPPSLRLLP